PLVHAASEPADTLAWFERSRTPFLIPDGKFATQLVFALHTSDGPLLVLVHLEPSASRHNRYHQGRVTQTDPGRYYSSDRHARKQLRAVFSTFPAPAQTSKAQAGTTTNMVQVYAFAEVRWQRQDPPLPPAATLRLDAILGRDRSASDNESTDEEEDKMHEFSSMMVHSSRENEDDERRPVWLDLRAGDIGQVIQ
ncbi:hypothetical protein AURDEDRAFT_168862, partial [Auricularia subglabra TFB-10046 SS5]